MASVQTRSMADKASLSGIRRSLRHDLAAAGVAEPVAFDCLVAVTEIWSRAARDGTADPGASVTWDITPTEARFYIQAERTRDGCKASHPSRGSVPRPAASAEELSLTLVTGLMDGVDVTEGAGGRIFCLTKIL